MLEPEWEATQSQQLSGVSCAVDRKPFALRLYSIQSKRLMDENVKVTGLGWCALVRFGALLGGFACLMLNKWTPRERDR
jgi:hypothetical protein